MSFWNRFPSNRLLVDLSLWSADLTDLATDVRRTAPFADLFHIDVADGHFVDQLLFFPDVVAALRRLTSTPMHVHLMVDNPARIAPAFAEAGADLITVHAETEHVSQAINVIRSHGKAAGLALRLDTDPATIVDHLAQVDAVVAICTPLGSKGTDASSEMPARIQALRHLISQHPRRAAIRIVADGGIRRHTVPRFAEAGVHAVVAGSLVFEAPDPADTVDWLRAAGLWAAGS
ncbi:ribulose-phosphate 3-epimerase [Plantactinospora mayteni]|uniref:D-allulose-6-phosphate 3-epimerase n=1 Tax=Plantactinospora mayteni TaxID=566021 RepID=A0ABQ4EIJ5_9ACTN|nr:ribulose-phosphate 3-epimerase [Plantactinospora mayteni]GIG94529.1 D-allulose-6-phosphate 3-epimerase [Plantactinospora mayteni]